MMNPDTKTFHKLIRMNQSNGSRSTACFNVNGKSLFDIQLQKETLKCYYEDLAIPKDDICFNEEYLEHSEFHLNLIRELLSVNRVCTTELFTDKEVKTCIQELKSGKSADEFGISAEHLKKSEHVIIPTLRDIFNDILRSGKVPEYFSGGVITPVPKPGKDPTIIDNYRGITVTPILGKLFEKLVLLRLLEYMNVEQSDLQFGFTKNLSPTMSSLICSEVINESRMEGKPLYIVTIDSQKAFDTVNHVILKKQLYEEGTPLDLWNIVDSLYSGLSSKVKWQGDISDSFEISQGVRQGGILSPHLYKTYVDPLLDELKRNALGAHIGTMYVGSVAVADDFLFMSNCAHELQTMFNVSKEFASERRYKIHPTKTTLVTRITTSTSRARDVGRKWYMGNSEVSENTKTEHLGMIRSVKDENKLNIQKRTSLARRTLYSLIKTGLHGCNGLTAKISFKIYQVYVLPRLLYGLEVLSLSKKLLDELETFHLEVLKNIQSLPTRTANSVVYLLLGAFPLKAEIEKKQLGLLYSIVTSENQTLQQFWNRQYALQNDGSFFKNVRELIERYELPPPSEMRNMSRDQWKIRVKRTLRCYWTEQLQREAGDKSTLKYCNLDSMLMGTTHPVWDTVLPNRLDVMRAIIKVRMLTGTYLLQTHRMKFKMDGVADATCPLCYLEDEDLVHMLTRCPALSETRNRFVRVIKKKFQAAVGPSAWSERIRDPSTLVQLIVNCQNLVPVTIPDSEELLRSIEVDSRILCYKLHLKRLYLYNVIKEGSGGDMAADPSIIK